MPKYFKTEIKISKKAVKNNVSIFRNLINKNTKLMAVVKSNAYGHGIFAIPKLIEKDVDWFGVDSMAEALRFNPGHRLQFPIKRKRTIKGVGVPKARPRCCA